MSAVEQTIELRWETKTNHKAILNPQTAFVSKHIAFEAPIHAS
jgi:hypothetical protein